MKKNILLSVLSWLLLTMSAFAFSFGIDSPSIHITSSAGSSTEKELVVYNQSAEEMAIKVSVQDWKYREDRTKLFMRSGDSPYSCAAWITPEQNSFTLAPNEKKKFKFTFKTPTDAKGGHQAVLFFEGVPSKADTKKATGVQILGKIGAIIYQHTEGKTTAKGQLGDISASATGRSISVTMQFLNIGDDWLQPKANAVLVDSKGKTVARGDFTVLKTLPGESASGTTTLKSFIPLEAGTYKVIVTVDTGEDVLMKETSVAIQ